MDYTYIIVQKDGLGNKNIRKNVKIEKIRGDNLK